MIPVLSEFDPAYVQAVHFLHYEAELLDDRRLHDWLGLLTADIDYRIPTRVTLDHETRSSEFSEKSFFMFEDLGSLRTRITRFDSPYAFAEQPPTRTRRIIGNVRIGPSERDGEISVKSNFILFRGKTDLAPQLLAGERHDVLRVADDGLRLARRLVLLDHTVLPMENLAIFL